MQEQYRELPHSPQRVELCREFVAVADWLEEHLDRFRAAERDDVSDCAVCETGAMAEYLLALGRRTEAVVLVEELLEKQEFCEEQPWKLLSILTDDALARNDLREAEHFSAAMICAGWAPCCG